MYKRIVNSNQGKNDEGSAAKPIECPKLVKGIAVKTAIPVKVSRVSGADARLCIKGIFGVRIM